MRQISILNGIVFAIIISLLSALLINLLPLIFTLVSSYSLTIAVLSLAYLVYLCRYSEIRQGRIIIIAAGISINLAAWLFEFDLITQTGFNLSTIWLVRSLYFHSSLLAAFLDLLLVIMATGAGTWALLQTESLIAAAWCFFLCQSLFSAIPDSSRFANKIGPDRKDSDRFQAAHRIAQDAVRKLSLN